MKVNKYQRILLNTYEGGKFAHFTELHEINNAGDILFAFLFAELSDAKGCDSLEEAKDRIARVSNLIEDVWDASLKAKD